MRASVGIILLIILATIAVLLPAPGKWLAGGGGSAGTDRVLFTVWGAPFEDSLFEGVYARDYESFRPGVRVEYRRFGEDLLQKYNAWHALGTGPEVMRIRITDYHGMVARGMLEPLGTLIRDPATELPPEIYNDLPSFIMSELDVNGEIYAIPEDNAQYGLFYNIALFEAYNKEHPDRPLSMPSEDWTWEDLRLAASLLTKRGPSGEVEIAGIDFAIWAWPFMNFFAQAGGQLWDDAGTTCTIASPAGVRTLEFFRALQRDDRSLRVSLGRNSMTGPEAHFANGRTAMMLDGSWRVPWFDRSAPELRFAVAPPTRGPSEGGVPRVVSGSVLWGISSRAANKEEGWRMLRWLVMDEQVRAYWDVLRVAPPARVAFVNSAAFTQTAGLQLPDGTWEVPPMRADQFEAKAAWLRYANAPHPATGEPPGFIPTGMYQTDLENQIAVMFEKWLNPSDTEDAMSALLRVERTVNAMIDRDRRSKGLSPVIR